MQKWKRLLVEIFQPDGYQGRWVVEDGNLGLDLAYVRSCVESLRRDERYRDAAFQFLQDGEDCIIGVFCGREPPAAPRSGHVLPAEMFEPDAPNPPPAS